MSSALARVDARVDPGCLVKSMDKNGCAVDTVDAPKPCRIIDMDHPAAPVGPNAAKCDYLFLAEPGNRRPLWVVLLELKSTGLNASKVTSQLQGGARAAEQTVLGISPVEFLPVAAHGRKPHRGSMDKLAKMRVMFQGVGYRIVTMPCGLPLAACL